VSLRLIAISPVEAPKLNEEAVEGEPAPERRRACFDGDWLEIDVRGRGRMGEGSAVEGPAIVEFSEATCVVRPGWRGAIDGAGTLVLERP